MSSRSEESAFEAERLIDSKFADSDDPFTFDGRSFTVSDESGCYLEVGGVCREVADESTPASEVGR